jgi:predicted RecB family nuclease
MSYPIGDIDCLQPEMVDRLRSVGIRTSDKLLDAAMSLRGRKLLAEKTGIDEKSLLRLANQIDRMRVKGVGRDYAKLLQIVGVDTVRELGYRNPKRLAEAMAEANAKRKLVRVLPSEGTVKRWIEHAKKLPLKISY